MPVTLPRFVSLLNESGLISTADFEELRKKLPPHVRDSDDVKAVARELVQGGHLTPYQAAWLYQGRAKGLVLGNYVVIDKLGSGGMGQVFKARHRRMDRIVALKVLASKAVESPDALKRFHREVRAAARLSHANIVTAYDADESDGIHYLVMEYVDGADLASVIRVEGPLLVDRAIDYVIQAARGLDYAHRRDVIHRDVKPENLLVDSHGTVKILDMGLARVEHELGHADSPDDHDLTQAGQVMGTINYMSPEQALDTRMADARSDIYSLGCTLFRLLTGKVVYEGDTSMKKLVAHREAPVPSLRAARRDVSELLEGVFQKMVAKRPDDRFQTMQEVMDALDASRSRLRTPPAVKTVHQERPVQGPPVSRAIERPIAPPPAPRSANVSADVSAESRITPAPPVSEKRARKPLNPPPIAPPPISANDDFCDAIYAEAVEDEVDTYDLALAAMDAEMIAQPPPAPPPVNDTVRMEADHDTSINTKTLELSAPRSARRGIWIWLLLAAFLGTVLIILLLAFVLKPRGPQLTYDRPGIAGFWEMRLSARSDR